MNLMNATLTEVTGPGTVDRSGERTAEGATVWEGRLRVYLRRGSKMVTVNGNMNKVEFDQLVVKGHLPFSTDIGSQKNGSVLTVLDQRERTAVERKFRAVAVQRMAVGSPVDSVRIELAEERA